MRCFKNERDHRRLIPMVAFLVLTWTSSVQILPGVELMRREWPRNGAEVRGRLRIVDRSGEPVVNAIAWIGLGWGTIYCNLGSAPLASEPASTDENGFLPVDFSAFRIMSSGRREALLFVIMDGKLTCKELGWIRNEMEVEISPATKSEFKYKLEGVWPSDELEPNLEPQRIKGCEIPAEIRELGLLRVRLLEEERVLISDFDLSWANAVTSRRKNLEGHVAFSTYDCVRAAGWFRMTETFVLPTWNKIRIGVDESVNPRELESLSAAFSCLATVDYNDPGSCEARIPMSKIGAWEFSIPKRPRTRISLGLKARSAGLLIPKLKVRQKDESIIEVLLTISTGELCELRHKPDCYNDELRVIEYEYHTWHERKFQPDIVCGLGIQQTGTISQQTEHQSLGVDLTKSNRIDFHPPGHHQQFLALGIHNPAFKSIEIEREAAGAAFVKVPVLGKTVTLNWGVDLCPIQVVLPNGVPLREARVESVQVREMGHMTVFTDRHGCARVPIHEAREIQVIYHGQRRSFIVPDSPTAGSTKFVFEK